MIDIFGYFKSVLDVDDNPIVICNNQHIIVYMNKSGCQKYPKIKVGDNLLNCHNSRSVKLICQVVEWFNKDCNNNCVHTFYNEKDNRDVYMIALRDANNKLIGYYEKHCSRNKDNEPFYNMK